jgi:hypothetical protein
MIGTLAGGLKLRAELHGDGVEWPGRLSVISTLPITIAL